jgi:hypothetical protein
VPDKIAQPPLHLAIYLVSTGAAHLRWLAELDAQRAIVTTGAKLIKNNRFGIIEAAG